MGEGVDDTQGAKEEEWSKSNPVIFNDYICTVTLKHGQISHKYTCTYLPSFRILAWCSRIWKALTTSWSYFEKDP